MSLPPPPSDDASVTFRWMQWFHEVYKELQLPIQDFDLEVSRGNINGISAINKFGRCPDNVDIGAQSDLWDGADAATGTKIWVAPTTARIHNIVSTSASDDGAPVGAGARTIQVYGLTSWDSTETSEVITMNGVTNVATTNSYVIIHRMKVLTKGSTSSNVGVITATAVTDGTITAQINANQGQTQMAIYGIPSTQTLYLTDYYSSVNRAVAGAANIGLNVNPEPDSELTQFVTKHVNAINSTGSSYFAQNFSPKYKITGPAILKVSASGSANNMDVSGGFNGYLVTN